MLICILKVAGSSREVPQLGHFFDWDPWDPEKSQEFLNFVESHKYLLYFNYKEKDKFDIII